VKTTIRPVAFQTDLRLVTWSFNTLAVIDNHALFDWDYRSNQYWKNGIISFTVLFLAWVLISSPLDMVCSALNPI
jgi:hypothetical protein